MYVCIFITCMNVMYYRVSPEFIGSRNCVPMAFTEGAVRRGRGGKEKEWTDCVQSDIRTFGIAGDWKATALNAEVWVETVAEGGRRFMAAWRKEEVDAARHRQEKREATRLGTLLSQTGV